MMIRLLTMMFVVGFSQLQALLWTLPQTIETSTNNTPFMNLAIDSYGNATLIWQDGDIESASAVVKTAFLPFGGSWSSPQTISTPGISAQAPFVSVNASGYAVAVWLQNGVVFATRPLHGSWSSPVYIGINPPYIQWVRVIVDASGNAIITATNAAGNVMDAVYIPFGGSPSAPTPISDVVGTRGTVNGTLAIDGSGNIRAIWVANAFDSPEFLATNLYSGGTWGSPETITSTPNSIQETLPAPQILLDNAGNATAIWGEGSSGNYELVYSSVLPFGGGSWSSPTLVFSNANQATASVNALTGEVVAIAFGTTNQSIVASTLPLGGSWSSPVTLAPTDVFGIIPSITTDPSGNTYAAWVLQNGYTFEFQTATLPSNSSSWLTPFTTYTVQEVYAVNPIAIASGLSEHAVAVAFILNINGPYTLEGTTGRGLLFTPPFNLQGAQVLHKFPAQGDLINNLTWSAPSSYQVDRYNIYRGSPSNLIGSSTTTLFQDHQRVPGISYIYYVTALNKADEESGAVSTIVP